MADEKTAPEIPDVRAQAAESLAKAQAAVEYWAKEVADRRGQLDEARASLRRAEAAVADAYHGMGLNRDGTEKTPRAPKDAESPAPAPSTRPAVSEAADGAQGATGEATAERGEE